MISTSAIERPRTNSGITQRDLMGLGIGVTLLVIGGILAFGVRDQWSAVDLTAIGYVCMAVGVLAIILVLVVQSQRRRTMHTSVVERRNVGGGEPPVV
jgi:hypothetical protein